MTRRTQTLIVGVIVLLGLVIGGSQLPVQYAALGPGPTYNTLGSGAGQQIITISGRRANGTTGHLNMTTVSEYDRLDLLSAIRGWLSSDQAVVPREVLIPPDKTTKQVQQEAAQQFTTSQDSATSAALSYLGYPQKIVVSGVMDDSAAKGVLSSGDTVDSVNGKPAGTLNALTGTLTKITPGTVLTVGYTHKNKADSGRLRTVKATGRGGAAFGIQVVYEPKAPFDVTIRLSDVGGPSAGLMFALGIIAKVGKKNLTHGRFIAGTGEIAATGQVKEIGGIQLKMIAARRAGAVVFLVPAGNCSEAEARHPSGLRLVKVSTVQGAVAALTDIQAGKATPSCS